MDSLNSFLDGVARIFTLVVNTQSTATLSAVGLVLLIVALILAYIAVKSKPEQISGFVKFLLFLALVGGMVFSAAGPGLALLHISENVITRLSTDQAFTNLVDNSRVNYVIRLIAYNVDASPELAVDRLPKLGPKEQAYSFVASYDELVGYTAKEALEKVGLGYTNGQHVSAIIFPRGKPIYPANARGLLQVVRAVESQPGIELKERFLEGNTFNAAELKNLDDVGLPSYQVENFRDKYPRYCALAYKFNCTRTYSARPYVGGLFRDWHPLGFSRKDPSGDPCDLTPEKYCEFSGWSKTRSDWLPHFGARTFLMENLDISRISGRVLIDFDNPSHQVIPDIGVRR